MSKSLAVEAYLARFNLRELTENWLVHLATVMPEDPLRFLSDLINDHRTGSSTLVTCENPWCGITVVSKDYEEHLKNCRADRWTKCIRCDMRVEVSRVHQHRMHCHLVTCAQCGEFVFPRMLGLCPVAITQKASSTLAKLISGCGGSLGESPVQQQSSASSGAGGSSSNIGETPLRNLQSSWRRYNARNKFSNLAFRMVWDIIDYARESKLARSALFASRSDVFGSQHSLVSRLSVFNNMQGSSGVHSFGKRHSVSVSLENELETSIRAAHPVELFVSLYDNFFKQRKTVEYSTAKQLITDACKLLTGRPLVVYIRTPTSAGGQIVVVGDLHGQLKDLLYILNTFGLPSESRRYVFNGDFVDRGPYGCEVLLLIFALLCTFPESVNVNRGNHEDFKTNREYGFQEEVHAKYDDKADELLSDMIKSYKAMPLATVIDDKTLVLHGGLPRFIIPLSRINNIGHIRDVPTVEQADEDETLLVDILWSDPVERYKSRSLGLRHQGENWRTSARGCGIEYLAAHTTAFLLHNKLEFVIRSHEMVGGGYEMCHDEQCCTVFSASDYCGVSGNRGAVAIFSEGHNEATYHTWFIKDDEKEEEEFEECPEEEDEPGSPAEKPIGGITDGQNQSTPPPPGGIERKATLSSLLSANQRDCMQEMYEMIWINRYNLLSNFVHVDVEQTGLVSKVEWCEVLRKVLALDLPWYFVCPFLTEITTHNGIPSVQYALFLNTVESKCGQDFQKAWVEQAIKDVFKSLELPDDIVPSGVLAKRIEKKRQSHMMESFEHADSSSDLQNSGTGSAGGGGGGSGEKLPGLSPKPPSWKPGGNGVEEGGTRRARPSVGFAISSQQNEAANEKKGSEHALEAAATSSSAAFTPATPSQSQAWRSVKVNFNYIVSTLRAKSPAAAQLDDGEMYVLFRFFDGDFDGHVILGDLADIVEIYLDDDDDDNSGDDDDDKCYVGQAP